MHILQTQKKQKGYSLIEVIIAVALLMFAIVGPMTIAVKGTQSAQYARQQNTAFFLAQEGISIVNTLRNDAGLAVYVSGATDPWTWTDASELAPCKAAYGCNIDMTDTTLLNNITSCQTPASCQLSYTTTGGRLFYRIGTGDATPYRRIITLQDVGTDEILVHSRVEWDSTLLGETQSVSANTSLFNIFKE